jgi:hypothetical protein
MPDNGYKEFELTQAKFVAGKGELCFKEVLEDFTNAKYINILTYNISSKNDVLLNSLKEAGKRNIPIRVITNIPNRWETYFAENWKVNAKKTIDIYIKKLNPENIGKLASVLFRFDNHGKIVMTDNIIYWGSANYSDESKKNYECGTLSRDRELINFVQNMLIPSIIEESTNYYNRDYVSYIASMYSAMSYLHNVYREIYDASYGSYEDYDTNFETVEFFNFHDNYISWKLLEELMETTFEFEGLLDGIMDELEGEEESDWDEYKELDNLMRKFRKVFENKNAIINSLCYDLEEMAKFDEESYISNILSEQYGSVAYEETLDYYAQLAFEQGRGKKEELVERAEESIKELLKSLETYEEKLRDFVDKLEKLSQLNEAIDNTK